MAFMKYFETCVCLNHRAVILCILRCLGSLTAECTRELPSLRNEQLVSKGSEDTAEAGGRAGISQGSSVTPADPTLPWHVFPGGGAGVAAVLSVWHGAGH